MARVVLKKVPSTQQLLGIAVVSAGLVHSGWGTLAKSGTKVRSVTHPTPLSNLSTSHWVFVYRSSTPQSPHFMFMAQTRAAGVARFLTADNLVRPMPRG